MTVQRKIILSIIDIINTCTGKLSWGPVYLIWARGLEPPLHFLFSLRKFTACSSKFRIMPSKFYSVPLQIIQLCPSNLCCPSPFPIFKSMAAYVSCGTLHHTVSGMRRSNIILIYNMYFKHRLPMG